MGSGGRRFGRYDARHRDGAEPQKADRVPPPPKGVSDAERRAWEELAPQIRLARTYRRERYTALRLAVRALAAVDTAPANTSIASLKGMLEVASRLIGRFGLDPVSVLQAERAPPAKRDDDLDEFDR